MLHDVVRWFSPSACHTSLVCATARPRLVSATSKSYDLAAMPRNIFLQVAYDGTDFHGWQSQPGQRTVQGVLEDTLQHIVRHPLLLHGCGRTDSGVHAKGHVSHFFTDATLPADRLWHALSSRTPKDLAVIALHEAHSNFHARRSALSKLYRYRIVHSRIRPVGQRMHRYAYHCWDPLDMEKMREAARHFVGEMDFSSMTPRKIVRESMVRRVFRLEIERHLDEIRIDVEGDGFLYKQVRSMVGTLLEVGRGRLAPDDIKDIIQSRDRESAGPTAEPKGLCLEWVRYPSGVLATPVERTNDHGPAVATDSSDGTISG